MKTIFEKIIDGEVPATKIYEDERFLAFLDIAPVYHGHTLLIPKEPVVWMHEASDELIADIFVTAKKLMLAIKSGLACDFVQVGVVGDEVPHFHIHLIPRMHGSHAEGRKSYTNPEEMSEYAKKIKSHL